MENRTRVINANSEQANKSTLTCCKASSSHASKEDKKQNVSEFISEGIIPHSHSIICILSNDCLLLCHIWCIRCHFQPRMTENTVTRPHFAHHCLQPKIHVPSKQQSEHLQATGHVLEDRSLYSSCLTPSPYQLSPGFHPKSKRSQRKEGVCQSVNL
eukprot:760267-Hanusia_phi.AAC.6